MSERATRTKGKAMKRPSHVTVDLSLEVKCGTTIVTVIGDQLVAITARPAGAPDKEDEAQPPEDTWTGWDPAAPMLVVRDKFGVSLRDRNGEAIPAVDMTKLLEVTAQTTSPVSHVVAVTGGVRAVVRGAHRVDAENAGAAASDVAAMFDRIRSGSG